MNLLLSPHADDESLFASFTIIRYRPLVVICFPSSGDYGDTMMRLEESRRAVALLGGGPVEQLQGVATGDRACQLVPKLHALDGRIRPLRVFAPSRATSHPEHQAVALAAAEVFAGRLTTYHTYDLNAGGKVRKGGAVEFDPEWTARKRAALACYASQIKHPRARPFFEWDAAEYQE